MQGNMIVNGCVVTSAQASRVAAQAAVAPCPGTSASVQLSSTPGSHPGPLHQPNQTRATARQYRAPFTFWRGCTNNATTVCVTFSPWSQVAAGG